jgi:tol-pal system protein YbgF
MRLGLPPPAARGGGSVAASGGRLLPSAAGPALASPAEDRQARRPAWRAFLAAAFLFPASAHAALFDDEEARKRIADTNVRLTQVQRALDERLNALEQQLRSQGLVDLFNSVEQMRGDLARLRGQVEVLTYEIEQAQKRQRDLYVDLDTRMRKLETVPAGAAGGADPVPPAAGPGAPPQVATAPPSSQPPAGAPRPAGDPAAEQRSYDAALDQFKRGDYAAAIAGFTNFVRAYPRSPLAASAQYWIGNAHYARREYRASITAQRALVTAYPDSSKVPDALLNIASAQSDLNDNAAARRTLEELIGKHPQSDAAVKAKQRLGMR